MQMIIEAEELFNAKSCSRRELLRLQLYSMEKNTHAIVTLQFRNKHQLVFVLQKNSIASNFDILRLLCHY